MILDEVFLINLHNLQQIEALFFYMKNRKQKAITPKRGHHILEETQYGEYSTNSGKNPSSHTKISTNCLHPTPEKRTKTRKNGKSSTKQNPSQAFLHQSNSKSGRKVKKYDLPLNMGVSCFDIGQQSCREYCVVQQNFVPITDFKQHKILEDMLSQTASTSCDQNFFKSEHKQRKPKLRKKSMSSQRLKESCLKDIQKQDKAVSNIQNQVEWISTEVEAKVQSYEIGMQYSERKEEVIEKNRIEEEIQEKVEQSQQISHVEEGSQNSLTDLLFKLEFSHLGDEQSFKHLSSNQKQHFTQLLETVITKLQPQSSTVTKNKIKPISFDSMNSESPHPSPEDKSPKQQIQDEKLEGLLLMREYTQLNCIEDSFNYSSNNQVNTSLISILNFLGYLFCHIEVHYSQEFIYMIRKMYGFPFRQKYKRVTRNMSLTNNTKFKVVDQSIFEDMVNDNSGTEYNYHQIVHFKAVFDAFNEHLEEYRPYYLGNGEQFPWAFKMFITMSEYSIDEDSLQIIFRQAKDKIIEWATNLCGIHINIDEKLDQNNPLELKNVQKQNKLISTWIAQQNFTKDGIELYSTQTLHEAAQKIYAQLLQEFIQEANFVFN